MTVYVRSDVAATSYLPVFQPVGETLNKGVRTVLFNNLDQSGTTLAQAKEAQLGLLMPRDKARGNIRVDFNYREPMADRADGTPRFFVAAGAMYLPADATPTEKDLFRLRVGDLLLCSSFGTVVKNGVVGGL